MNIKEFLKQPSIQEELKKQGTEVDFDEIDRLEEQFEALSALFRPLEIPSGETLEKI